MKLVFPTKIKHTLIEYSNGAKHICCEIHLGVNIIKSILPQIEARENHKKYTHSEANLMEYSVYIILAKKDTDNSRRR